MADDTKEIIAFLAEQSQKDRTSLREEADANRELLNTTLKWISLPLSILVAVGGLFGLHSIVDITDQANRTSDKLERQQQQTTDWLEKQQQLHFDALQKDESNQAAALRDQGKTVASQMLAEESVALRKVTRDAEDQTQVRLNDKFKEERVIGTIETALKKSTVVSDALKPWTAKTKKELDEELKRVDLQLQQKIAKEVIQVNDHAARPMIRPAPLGLSAEESPVDVVRLTAEFNNIGLLHAKDVFGYSALKVSLGAPTSQTFRELANEIAATKKKRAAKGQYLLDLAPDKSLSLSANLSVKDEFLTRMLQQGSSRIAFLYWIEYASANGGTFYTVECGSTGGDIADMSSWQFVPCKTLDGTFTTLTGKP